MFNIRLKPEIRFYPDLMISYLAKIVKLRGFTANSIHSQQPMNIAH
ncbi:hypothetical protein SAMN04488084_102262 [Pedobacter antarcticus]|uniref:Uncharacterized protein n=1 Tax=Pedobacter antarcticus TaxID=34086 RepID=A0A1I2DY33_9SPHI|nr:hypothetical protein SAMN04488084_102262 [Pedobacter antarcticus]SFE85632.1 hypothetical protein SAMN03003324_01545 [Pedobacter antarcticus]